MSGKGRKLRCCKVRQFLCAHRVRHHKPLCSPQPLRVQAATNVGLESLKVFCGQQDVLWRQAPAPGLKSSNQMLPARAVAFELSHRIVQRVPALRLLAEQTSCTSKLMLHPKSGSIHACQRSHPEVLKKEQAPLQEP